MTLPVEAIRPALERRLCQGPVVLSSPTGSGKSTQVPRWCRRFGPVLVIEPRRIACRSLATYVAKLEAQRLGQGVGYWVRDDHRATDTTEILFATPGIVLRMLQQPGGWFNRCQTVILDEFHERSIEIDLLYALLQDQFEGKLVVMSATLAGDTIAAHLGGAHLQAEGRLFPVDIRYEDAKNTAPSEQQLAKRVLRSLKTLHDVQGDILVFLPGKPEIRDCESLLTRHTSDEILCLHGGLSLDQQNRAFNPGEKRRIILSTNVAETSLTLPRISAVIDSGLVRRTRYFQGQGYLSLMPVAQDSADQRTGRAGRLQAGRCLRLWGERAALKTQTPPEIERESLVPLLLSAAACGHPNLQLRFLDVPKEHAVTSAREELIALGALDESGLTARGERLFGLPLDARLGRILIQGKEDGQLGAVIDLVSVLSTQRPLVIGLTSALDEEAEPWTCDAVRAIHVLRELRHPFKVNPHSLNEAKRIRARLRRAFKQAGAPPSGPHIDREALALTLLRADPRAAFLRRERRKRHYWSNGGTEVNLSPRSLVSAEHTQALIMLSTFAHSQSRLKTERLITRAMPIPSQWMVSAGLGRDRIGRVHIERRRAVCTIERVFAGRVLSTRSAIPEGDLAIQALCTLFLRGSFGSKALKQSLDNHAAQSLYAKLNALNAPPEFEAWLTQHVIALGVQSGDDLALLEPEDLIYEDLPSHLREAQDKAFPPTLSLPDARYRASYEPHKKTVIIEQIGGSRKSPPPLSWLPNYSGWRIQFKVHSKVVVLRQRR